jgi:hypothetical protein
MTLELIGMCIWSHLLNTSNGAGKNKNSAICSISLGPMAITFHASEGGQKSGSVTFREAAAALCHSSSAVGRPLDQDVWKTIFIPCLYVIEGTALTIRSEE